MVARSFSPAVFAFLFWIRLASAVQYRPRSLVGYSQCRAEFILKEVGSLAFFAAAPGTIGKYAEDTTETTLGQRQKRNRSPSRRHHHGLRLRLGYYELCLQNAQRAPCSTSNARCLRSPHSRPAL